MLQVSCVKLCAEKQHKGSNIRVVLSSGCTLEALDSLLVGEQGGCGGRCAVM